MKRMIIALIAIAVLLAMTTVAYADDAVFTPKVYKTAQGTAILDGVKDKAYELSDMFIVENGGLDRELLDGHATAKAWTLWDEENLYVYVEVNDTTPGGVPTKDDPAWENESIEIYVDYEDNKEYQNKLAASAEACQLRVCRYPESYPDITGEGLFQSDFAAGTTYKVIDNGTDGYIVEAVIKHSQYSFIGKIGFSVQINDDMDGDKVRDSIVYVDALQKDAWQFTDLLDTIELEGYVAPSQDTSSEDTSSADVSEEISSADINEEPSQTVSLGISSESGNTNSPKYDFVISITVFLLAAAAITGIVVFTTKKK